MPGGNDSKNTWKTIGVSTSIIVPVIGDELRKARNAAGLSQETLGFLAKLSRNYISMVELNQNSPTLDTLIRMCQALGIPAATLVARVERELDGRKPAVRGKPRR